MDYIFYRANTPTWQAYIPPITYLMPTWTPAAAADWIQAWMQYFAEFMRGTRLVGET